MVKGGFLEQEEDTNPSPKNAALGLLGNGPETNQIVESSRESNYELQAGSGV